MLYNRPTSILNRLNLFFLPISHIFPEREVSYFLKFDFCVFLGDIKRDLTCPYITITGKWDLLVNRLKTRKNQISWISSVSCQMVGFASLSEGIL